MNLDKQTVDFLNQNFKAYEFPFKGADDELRKMEKDEKERYLHAVWEFVQSGALDNEIAELTRHFVKELAFTLTDQTQQTAYRITLLFIQKFEQRMRYLASLSKQK